MGYPFFVLKGKHKRLPQWVCGQKVASIKNATKKLKIIQARTAGKQGGKKEKLDTTKT